MITFPMILAHISSLDNDTKFITSNYILDKKDFTVKIFNRNCPHRLYPIGQPGKRVNELHCNFHGLKWDKQCNPVNHNYNLIESFADISSSGLISVNFTQPDSIWVDDLINEKNLQYSHSSFGNSKGSWLWMIDIQSDLLHIQQGEDVIHPEFSKQVNLNKIKMSKGDGWVLQENEKGWWLFVYPFNFLEYRKGCLAINNLIPHSYNEEFGFDWMTQYYYSTNVSLSEKQDFELIEQALQEDVMAIEKQKKPFFPLRTALNNLEDHSVYFGQWIEKNLIKIKSML